VQTDPESVTQQAVAPRYWPAVPHTPEELGTDWALVLDVALRRVYFDGTTNLSSLARELRISFPMANEIFRHFRKQAAVDILSSIGEDFTFTLTSAGLQAAVNRLNLSHYAGPVPVSIEQYEQAVKAQAAEVDVTEETMREALSDLVVTDELLEELGPGVISQKSLFLYGPTGVGKTSIAERLVRLFHDTIIVPHAVAVGGQIIQFSDPIIHQPVEIDYADRDPRWVVCRRPIVIAGGELSREMLDLRFDPAARVYAPPVQMKANNGILIIDDFGRQAIPAKQLLNRWIVPLDRRVDYLALQHGTKFAIPFELMVVFATNLDPNELADEAFLRRIPNKVYIPSCSPEIFDEVFARVVKELGLEAPSGAAELTRRLCREAGAKELRACYPRDICLILVWMGRYKRRRPEINESNLRRAVKLYFTRERSFIGSS